MLKNVEPLPLLPLVYHYSAATLDHPFNVVHQCTCLMSAAGSALPGPVVEPSSYLTSGCKEYYVHASSAGEVEGLMKSESVTCTFDPSIPQERKWKRAQKSFCQHLRDDNFSIGLGQSLLEGKDENVVGAQRYFLFQVECK